MVNLKILFAAVLLSLPVVATAAEKADTTAKDTSFVFTDIKVNPTTSKTNREHAGAFPACRLWKTNC